MSIPAAFLDEIRARVGLATVVGRRVKLTRAGREMKGCCPFHNEKTPSFYVNEDKGFYHCFGCGEHGSVIDFVIKQEGLAFRDAVESLAAEAGLDMPLESPEGQQRAKVAAGLHDVTGRAAAWFTEQLGSVGGAAARGYLEKRGLSAETVRTFGLGLAPDGRKQLKGALIELGEERLVETGMLIAPEDGGDSYDRFRGRLMFPIRDARGRVIAFGGRILGDGQPKYLNSPDTPLFDKGRTLYNLDRAGPVARKSARLLVVEGYMDVIALAQAGIAEAVAPLGTALTEQQLQLLWRVVPEPILCFDGDTAGQRAGLRAALRALPLLEPGRSLRLATLPAGQDPDDLVRTQGKAAFEQLLAQAEPLIDRLWRAETEGIDTTTPERRAGVRERLREHSQAIQNPSVRSLYDAEFRSRFDALYLPQRAPFVPGKRGAAFPAPPSRASAALKALHARPSAAGEHLALLVGVLENPRLADRFGESLAHLELEDMQLKRLLFAVLDAVTHDPDLDKSALAHDLHLRGLAEIADQVRQSNLLGFSFTRSVLPDQVSGHAVAIERDFAAVVDTVLLRTRIESELAAATARYAQSETQSNWDAQQRLRAEKASITAMLMSLTETLRGAQLEEN